LQIEFPLLGTNIGSDVLRCVAEGAHAADEEIGPGLLISGRPSLHDPGRGRKGEGTNVVAAGVLGLLIVVVRKPVFQIVASEYLAHVVVAVIVPVDIDVRSKPGDTGPAA